MFEGGSARSGLMDRFRPTTKLITQVDVIVVDEGDRLPISRHRLTPATDVASRVVLGFSISLEGASAVSVALTPVQGRVCDAGTLRGLDPCAPGLPALSSFEPDV